MLNCFLNTHPILIALAIFSFHTICLLPNLAEQFKENDLAQEVLNDIKENIDSFEPFSMNACDAFEQFLITSNEIAKKCPLVRIHYKKDTGFTIGYHTKTNDIHGWFFPCRIEQTLMPFLNSLNFKNDINFSFFVPFYDSSCYPEKMESFFSEIPILGCDKKKRCRNKLILIPDFFCLNKDFEKEVHDICAANAQNPFLNRLDIAGFRGALSGGFASMESFGKIPRLDLVMLSHKHPDYIDARSTGPYSFYAKKSDCGKQYIEFMHQTFGEPASFVPFHEMTRYRYNISLDGWVSAWKRPLQIMFTGSVPLFQTKYDTYYSPYLVENIHYVSFKADMSDIITKIDMLRASSGLALSITEEAQKFAHAILTPHFHKEFMCTLLTAIAQKFDTKAHEETEAV